MSRQTNRGCRPGGSASRQHSSRGLFCVSHYHANRITSGQCSHRPHQPILELLRSEEANASRTDHRSAYGEVGCFPVKIIMSIIVPSSVTLRTGTSKDRLLLTNVGVWNSFKRKRNFNESCFCVHPDCDFQFFFSTLSMKSEP